MARPSQRLTKTITTTYTITLADCGYKIICNSASPFTITLPSATGLYNFDVFIQNKGAGSVTCDSKVIPTNGGLFLSNDAGSAWVSTLINPGGISVNAVAIKSATYTLTSADNTVVFTATATANLPAATGSGRTYRIICRAGTTTIDGNASETIKGELTQTLYEGEDLIITDTESGKWE